mmetsp:Transcript_41700/g.82303  ORF Transcript_41700/g.82303 Transcript_41700/m.82303 type:complete len:124 (-) Transcript_41700:681-1052(-)
MLSRLQQGTSYIDAQTERASWPEGKEKRGGRAKVGQGNELTGINSFVCALRLPSCFPVCLPSPPSPLFLIFCTSEVCRKNERKKEIPRSLDEDGQKPLAKTYLYFSFVNSCMNPIAVQQRAFV